MHFIVYPLPGVPMSFVPRSSDIENLNWLQNTNHKAWTNQSIVDLGCGSGFLCEHMTTLGAKKVIGADLCEPASQKQNKKSSWLFQQANLDAPHWEDKIRELCGDACDSVFAFDILEHVNSPFQFLESCRRLLAANGQLFLRTPNTLSWERFAKPASWSGVMDPQHKTLFHRYSLEFLLRKSGFKHVSIQAPMRSLKFLGPLQPHIGGQIFCVATA